MPRRSTRHLSLSLLAVTAALAAPPGGATDRCPEDNGGLSLPPGFCATVFADRIGHARHLAVAADGTVYVNTWSGAYYRHLGPESLPPGGFLVALRDSHGSGHADLIKRFGDTAKQGAHGGTGIALFDHALYAEVNDRIERYALQPGQMVPTGRPQVVLSGLPLTGDHPMHPFVIDAAGNLFIDLGSASNACGIHDRMPNSRGHDPCTELDTRGGIWRYDARRLHQRFTPAERYATGLRNGEGMGFDSAGRLFVTQHGRDQLLENYPQFYDQARGHELPAEEVVLLVKGADYGWPMCYFDGLRRQLVLAPEYGGNGELVGICARKTPPAFFFPAHWAPDDLAIYKGSQFPAAYRDGAFIAFHGSWNRAPAAQAGYNVVFQPLSAGHPSGDYIVFADGFAGPGRDSGHARARPAGLAVGPDGSLYVAEDVAGRIWRITYSGPQQAALQPAPSPDYGAGRGTAVDVAALGEPPGATPEQVQLGARIFRGEVSGGTCSGCHGSDARGSTMGPDLTTGRWLWSDGSWQGIADTINHGVAQPKQLSGVMPPRGGAPLTDADVRAVAAYVWAVGHQERAGVRSH